MKNAGFTLIELVTVMAVMGIVLFFTLPRFDVFNPFGASITPTGKLLLLVEQLKSRAIETGQGFFLHLDPATGKVWVTASTVSETAEGGEEMVSAKQDGLENASMSEPVIVFSDECVLEDVKMPETVRNQGMEADDIVICFTGEGYCDQAFILIRENDLDFTIVLEPFLPRAQLVDGHVVCGE